MHPVGVGLEVQDGLPVRPVPLLDVVVGRIAGYPGVSGGEVIQEELDGDTVRHSELNRVRYPSLSFVEHSPGGLLLLQPTSTHFFLFQLIASIHRDSPSRLPSGPSRG